MVRYSSAYAMLQWAEVSKAVSLRPHSCFLLFFTKALCHLPNTEALPAALCKVDEEFVECDALLGSFDPPFGVKGERVRKYRWIRMHEISRLTDRSLC